MHKISSGGGGLSEKFSLTTVFLYKKHIIQKVDSTNYGQFLEFIP